MDRAPILASVINHVLSLKTQFLPVPNGRPVGAPRTPMGDLWTIHGRPTYTRRVTHGQPMGDPCTYTPWATYGQPVGAPQIPHGRPTDNPWTIHVHPRGDLLTPHCPRGARGVSVGRRRGVGRSSMGRKCSAHGSPAFRPCAVRRLSVGCSSSGTHGLHMGRPCVVRGAPMGCSWVTHGSPAGPP